MGGAKIRLLPGVGLSLGPPLGKRERALGIADISAAWLRVGHRAATATPHGLECRRERYLLPVLGRA